MSLIVGLASTISSSRRTGQRWCCTAQCLEANPVSSIGVVAAHCCQWKLPANGFEGSLPNLPTGQIYTATAQM